MLSHFDVKRLRFISKQFSIHSRASPLFCQASPHLIKMLYKDIVFTPIIKE